MIFICWFTREPCFAALLGGGCVATSESVSGFESGVARRTPRRWREDRAQVKFRQVWSAARSTAFEGGGGHGVKGNKTEEKY